MLTVETNVVCFQVDNRVNWKSHVGFVVRKLLIACGGILRTI